MNATLPRYVETRPGEPPDAYLLDGDHITPLSRIERSADAAPSLAAPLLPADLLATIAPVQSAIDSVDQVHAAVSNVDFGDTPLVTSDAIREGPLALHRAEMEGLRNSAA